MKDSWLFVLQGFWARYSKAIFIVLGLSTVGLGAWSLFVFPSTTQPVGEVSQVADTGGSLPLLEAGRSRIALPVPIGVARLFKSGNHLDIYAPGECEQSLRCPAQRVATNVLVAQTPTTSADWMGNSDASLVLDVTNADVESLAGVSETAILRYILINEK